MKSSACRFVYDPGLPERTKRRLQRYHNDERTKPSRVESAVEKIWLFCLTIAGLAVVSPLAYIAVHPIHPLHGLGLMLPYAIWILAGSLGLGALVGLLWLASRALFAISGSTSRVLSVISHQRAVHRHRDKIIDVSKLTPDCQGLLGRAQQAMAAVRSSAVFAAGLLDKPRIEITFRVIEWELACQLREISQLKFDQQQLLEPTPGTGSARQDAEQKEDLRKGQQGWVQLVEGLEFDAAKVKDADQEYRANQQRHQVALKDEELEAQLSRLADRIKQVRARGEAVAPLLCSDVTRQAQDAETLAQSLRKDDQDPGPPIR
jgi:hypothetical protein